MSINAMEASSSHPNAPADILDAEREVELRKSELNDSPRVAGEGGSRLAHSVGTQAKPVIIGAAVVVGLAAVVGIVAVSRSRRRVLFQAPRRVSLFSNVARGAGFWLVRMAARRLAEEAASRLSDAGLSVTTPRAPIPPLGAR
jgi:hypothetical protein